jgi:hypothetical protein
VLYIMITIHICVISSCVDNFCPQKWWMWLSNAMHLNLFHFLFFATPFWCGKSTIVSSFEFHVYFHRRYSWELMEGKLSSFVSFQNLNLWLSGNFYKIFEDFELVERFILMTHKVNPKFSCEIMSENDKTPWAF